MSANNGGPAFPLPAHISQNTSTGETTNYQWLSDGMSLRDYLAAHADIGNVDELPFTSGVRLLGMPCPEFKDDTAGCFAWWAKYRAKLRYIEADAMLAERVKGGA